MATHDYDLIVIGAGSGGGELAEYLPLLGLRLLLLKKTA